MDVNQIINQLMNRGLRTVLQNIMRSANPEQMTMAMMDRKFGNNPMWQQAKQMAQGGNAKEKAKNMFGERGIDIENVVDGIVKEIN